jgi:hypothetical protein
MPDESYPPLIKVEKIFGLDFKPQNNSTKENIDLVNLIGDVVCDNQSMLSQYCCLLSLRHKALKDKFRESPHDRDSLKKLYNELEIYAYKTLKSIVRKNLSCALKVFQDRIHTKTPRICLKLVTGDTIISAFRDRESSLDEKYYNKSDNTAFQKICMGESHYLCNNIPEDAKKGLYINARIVDKNKLDTYREQNIFNDILSRLPGSKVHTNWKDCWEKIDTELDRSDLREPPSETCYKSTLVVPLSLKRSDLDQRFVDQFDNAKNDKETERLIFGFLCFDYQEVNFFNETSDIKMGYIFADILSLYLMVRKMYTECSTTYNRMSLDFFND